MNTVIRIALCLAGAGGLAAADEVTEWNRVLLDCLLGPPAVGAPLAQRPAAMVHAAVFDAVNGIARRYTPIHVLPGAPAGASKRAAVVQAAYAILVRLFPAQATTLDLKRTNSLAAIAGDRDGDAGDRNQSMARGIAWGQTVADSIWAWRSSDGALTVVPPFNGGLATGQWRPTLPAFASGLAPQLAQATPWAIASPSQFRPGGPLSLTSDRYAVDFNETKSLGSATSSTRTSDQTLYAQFWQSTSPADFWDPVATSLSTARDFNLLESARLLAYLNMALADAVIGCWDAKYAYDSWRPITAIQLADTDGNPNTSPDMAWMPLIPTPPFPEYPSAHSCVSGAASRILSAYFGDNTTFSVTSDTMPGTARYFSSFTAALEEIKNARIVGGIHFRTACEDGQALGTAIANYILSHSLLRVHPNERR